MILSNSCDIDLDNKRKFNGNILYTPIIYLEKYIRMLEQNGDSKKSINTSAPLVDAIMARFTCAVMDNASFETIPF